MNRRFLAVALGAGLPLAPLATTAAAAPPTPRGADRAAVALFAGDPVLARDARALCNPVRNRTTGAQSTRRWECEVAVSATPEEVAASTGAATTPADPRPLKTTVAVAWADGEYEAREAGELVWAPQTTDVPRLGMVTARELVWDALSQGPFPDRSLLGERSFRCTRSTATAVRCRVLWDIGDSRTSGVVRVRATGPVDAGAWTYSWNLRTLDGYCRYVLKRSLARCSTRDVVR